MDKIEGYLDKIKDLAKLNDPKQVMTDGLKIINKYISSFSKIDRGALELYLWTIRLEEKCSRTHTKYIERVKKRLDKIDIKRANIFNQIYYLYANLIVIYYKVGIKQTFINFARISGKNNKEK